MSDDLIRRQAAIDILLKQLIQNGDMYLAADAPKWVGSLPTVFNKGNAIKELKQNRDIAEAEYKVAGEYGDDGNFLLGKVMAYDIAMAIVEKGGIE